MLRDDAHPYDAIRDDDVDAGLRVALTPAAESSSPDSSGAAGGAENPRPPDERYRIDGEIGRGGVGVVLRGRDLDFGRDVAMKVLLERHRSRPRVVARFVEEARIAARLQHRGIVPVHDFGVLADGRPFFTMRLIEGATLAALLAARASPDADRRRFLGIFEQVCHAVAYAHARGIVHLDLKPANVMVGSFGEVQVMDWGLSRVLAADDASAEGSVMGTPGYVSPEAARGEVRSLDARADVFGLGAMLCEILTGEPPVAGETPRETIRLAAEGDLSRALDRLSACAVEPELGALAAACLAAKPDARPAHAGAVAGAITAYVESIEERAQAARILAAETRAKAEHAVRQRRLAVALAASVCLTAVVGGTAAWWLEREDRRRADATATAVSAALADAVRFEGEARSSAGANALAAWDRAKASVERATSLLTAGDADSALAARVGAVAARVGEEAAIAHDRAREAERDAAMIARLESVRAPEERDFDPADNERLDAEYASAFHEYGIDVDALGPAEAARAVAGSRIALALVGAIDDWAERRLHVESPRWSRENGLRLLDIATAADPDERRNALRRSLRTNDVDALRALAASADPTNWPKETLLLLGRQLLRASLRDQGLNVLRRAQELHPDDFRIAFQLGCAVHSSGARFRDEAARYFSIARAIRPANVEVLHRLARTCVELDRREFGERLSAQAISLRPGDGHLLAHLGAFQLSLRGVDAALPVLLEAVRLAPNDPFTWFQLANARFDQGDWAAAEEAIREALALDPDYADAWFNLGCILDHRSDIEGEMAAYRKTLEIDPGYSRALGNLVALHAQRGEWAAAAPLMKRWLDLDPTNAANQRLWAIVLRSTGDPDGARAALNESVRLDSNDAESRWELAQTEFMAGDLDRSIGWLRDAIRIQPNDHRYQRDLARVARALGLEADLVASQRELVRLLPDDDSFRNDLAWSLATAADPRLRDGKRAVELARRCVERAPDVARFRNTLGVALLRNGDAAGAIEALRHAMGMNDGDSVSRLFLSMALENAGDHAAALEWFAKATASEPASTLTPGEWARFVGEATALIEPR